MKPRYRIITVPAQFGEVMDLIWFTWMDDRVGRHGVVFDESRKWATFYKLISWE